MANHGFVEKCESPITPDGVTLALEFLRERFATGELFITEDHNQPHGWGKWCWEVMYREEGKDWAKKICWINEENNFEILHGGGSDFTWYLDFCIRHVIADAFTGVVTDESDDREVPSRWREETTFEEFFKEMHTNWDNYPDDHKGFLMERVPPSFRFE